MSTNVRLLVGVDVSKDMLDAYASTRQSPPTLCQ